MSIKITKHNQLDPNRTGGKSEERAWWVCGAVSEALRVKWLCW